MPHNKNIDRRGPGPLNLMFANQFKCITRVKLKVFILKGTNWVLFEPFYKRNAINKNGFNIWQSARGSALM